MILQPKTKSSFKFLPLSPDPKVLFPKCLNRTALSPLWNRCTVSILLFGRPSCVYGKLFSMSVTEGAEKPSVFSAPSGGVCRYVLKWQPGASLVAQWMKIHLPMQETQVQSLVQKIPHALEQLNPCTTTCEPVLKGLWVATTEPVCHNYLSPSTRETTAIKKPFAIVQSLSRVRLSATPWTAACQASLSFTIS